MVIPFTLVIIGHIAAVGYHVMVLYPGTSHIPTLLATDLNLKIAQKLPARLLDEIKGDQDVVWGKGRTLAEHTGSCWNFTPQVVK